MKTNNYLLVLGTKIEKAYTTIEYGQNYADKQADPFYQELIQFCKENKELDLKELNIKVNEKYGEYLRVYDQRKKEKQLATITTILVIILIITLISIIFEIVFATSFISSLHEVGSSIRYNY